MKSAETHPTPPHVMEAINTVASWLQEIEAAEVHIRPNGGAAYQLETHTDRVGSLLSALASAARLASQIEAERALILDRSEAAQERYVARLARAIDPSIEIRLALGRGLDAAELLLLMTAPVEMREAALKDTP